MGREVHAKADAHDEVDHGNGVEVHAPQRHVAHHAHLNGDDGEGDPQRAEGIRDEDKRNHHHDGSSKTDGLDTRRPH